MWSHGSCICIYIYIWLGLRLLGHWFFQVLFCQCFKSLPHIQTESEKQISQQPKVRPLSILPQRSKCQTPDDLALRSRQVSQRQTGIFGWAAWVEDWFRSTFFLTRACWHQARTCRCSRATGACKLNGPWTHSFLLLPSRPQSVEQNYKDDDQQI